jgi:hypothetical protein
MPTPEDHGVSADGTVLTDEVLARVAAEAEAGYDVEELKRRGRGRPPLGAAAAEAFPVRLDPELRASVSAEPCASTWRSERPWAATAPPTRCQPAANGASSEPAVPGRRRPFPSERLIICPGCEGLCAARGGRRRPARR